MEAKGLRWSETLADVADGQGFSTARINEVFKLAVAPARIRR